MKISIRKKGKFIILIMKIIRGKDNPLRIREFCCAQVFTYYHGFQPEVIRKVLGSNVLVWWKKVLAKELKSDTLQASLDL